MGIAGIPPLCVQQPSHILCVHLLLLCQQPFSYRINIFRSYVRMTLWRPGECHPCQVESEGATKHRGHWQHLRILSSQVMWAWHCILSFQFVYFHLWLFCVNSAWSLQQRDSEEITYLIRERHWDFWTIHYGLAPWLGPLCAAAV